MTVIDPSITNFIEIENRPTIEEDTPIISLCAFARIQGAYTIHVKGYGQFRFFLMVGVPIISLIKIL